MKQFIWSRKFKQMSPNVESQYQVISERSLLSKNSYKVLNFSQACHLGDCVFFMVYLYNCKDYIISNGITINFFINPEYISQIEEFVCCPNIRVFSLSENTPINMISTWIGEPTYPFNCKSELNKPDSYFDTFLSHFMTQLGSRWNLPPIGVFSYNDNDLDIRYDRLKECYKSTHILVINSKPCSGQYDYSSVETQWNHMIRRLSEKFKVSTTNKVDGIISTTDDNLTIKDIAAVSTRANYIIAINTGPLVGCFNELTFKSVKKWYVFDSNNAYKNNSFSNKNFIMNSCLIKLTGDILNSI